ncbi:MAG: pyridine nucleotide-disulfide oxidoreductase [Gammaproteobacteria bacterium]|nr:pyridine nucleotide-disulfide oxidoreductase [Gammaproteobacteria bacterium]
MPATDVVIVGAGHSGLAMSRCLAHAGIEHVVLERGEVANSWRTERWDSLRLLTPNWQNRLPDHAYAGDDPDGFATVPDVVDFISGYAAQIDAPVLTQTTVERVSAGEGGFALDTDRGTWFAGACVLASGACNVAIVPKCAADLPPNVRATTARDYRRPDDLDAGETLVVGASATGVQLAEEIHRSGRPVTLSVGEHVRLPRLYRGKDIQWWMTHAGILDEGIGEIDDLVRARNIPSPQLVGTPERRDLDLNALSDQGVRLVGRLGGIHGDRALFSGSLANICKLADLKMNRLLNTLDEWAMESGEYLVDSVEPPHRFDATRVPAAPELSLRLGREGIRNVVWATGYSPDLSWLDTPAFDRKGKLRHDGGVVAVPGLYVLGLSFLRRRKSSFIHGAEDDARDLAAHLVANLDDRASAKAPKHPKGGVARLVRPAQPSRSFEQQPSRSLSAQGTRSKTA